MSKHTLEQDFQHFMAYTNSDPADEAKLRVAYEHGASRGSRSESDIRERAMTLLNALDDTHWSSWQSTAKFSEPMESLRDILNGETP